jgi:hypothetical protein
MKILVTTYKDYTEVIVRDASGANLHTYTFDTPTEANAFITGWRTCQEVANSLIQSLPQSGTFIKAPTT